MYRQTAAKCTTAALTRRPTALILESESGVLCARYTGADIVVNPSLLVTATILPPHPAAIQETDKGAQSRHGKVDSQTRQVPRGLPRQVDVAGEEASAVANRVVHADGQGTGIQVGDVGHGPCRTEGSAGISLKKCVSQRNECGFRP